MGPLGRGLNDMRLNPALLANKEYSSNSTVSAGRLPTYSVLQGGLESGDELL